MMAEFSNAVFDPDVMTMGEYRREAGDVGGALCGAKSIERIVPTKGLHTLMRKAKCNRWANHAYPHRETDPKTFDNLAEWGEDATATRSDS
jgi:hypothetical protein